MTFPNFDKGPKKVILQKVPLKMTWWQNTHFKPITRTALCCHKISNIWLNWYRHLVTLICCKAKPRALCKIIPERVFLFLSFLFEGMDILVNLMENLLEPWYHNGYKNVIYGVSNHKTFDTKAYRWGESWLIYFNCLNDVLWLLVLCYLCLPRGAFVWPAMCDCGISWSYSLTFVAFGQALHQANRLENLVQLFNVESHAIGIKPVHGIDDTIAKFVCDKCVEKNGYVYFPDNIDIEWLIQLSCDNIALLKATWGSKLFT